jgi:hypothetical protein
VVEGDPEVHLVCHCDNCKKRTGSAFGMSAYFLDSQIRAKHGTTRIYEIDTEATQQERHYCTVCGTTLYWKIARFQGFPRVATMTGVAGGCFTENPLPAPTLNANSVKQCVWLELGQMKKWP